MRNLIGLFAWPTNVDDGAAVAAQCLGIIAIIADVIIIKMRNKNAICKT